MRLILIRHGQTPSNIAGLLDTAVPGPSLSELGRNQASAIPAALQSEGIEALYVSTATRAQETAAPLAAALGLQVQVRDGVKEIQAGDWEMTGEQPQIMSYLKVIRQWMVGDEHAAMPNAEAGTEVLARFDAVVQEALDAGHSTAAIVSHGAMIRTYSAIRAENMDREHPEKYRLSNTGVVVLDSVDDGGARPWRVASWNANPAGGTDLEDPHHAGPEPVSEAE